MITARDLGFLLVGAAIAAAGFALAGGLSIAGWFLVGAAMTGLVCLQAIRQRDAELEAAELARDSFRIEWFAAWGDANRLRRQAGEPPLVLPSPTDLRRTARCQEDPCSSNPSSAG